MNTIASLGMHKIFDRFDIAGSVYTVTSGIETAFTSTRNLFKTWAKRSAGRRDLAQLDWRMLQDIGADHADVHVEINKFFWQS